MESPYFPTRFALFCFLDAALFSAQYTSTITQLKAAKRGGCTGFQHGRVNVAAVKEWMKDNAGKLPDVSLDKNALECQKLRAQIARIEFQSERERGLHWLADDVRRGMLASIHNSKRILLQMPDDLPPVLVGLTAPEIQERLLERIDTAIAALAAGWIEHPEDTDEPS